MRFAWPRTAVVRSQRIRFSENWNTASPGAYARYLSADRESKRQPLRGAQGARNRCLSLVSYGVSYGTRS